MRIAVLADPESWYVRDLQRAAADRHEIIPLPFTELAGALESDGRVRVTCGDQDIARFDAVLVRTMPPGSLEQVVFRMDLLGRLEAQGTVVLNPPRAIEAAVDKFLASAKLHAAGLPTPRTAVCQTVDEGMAALKRLGGDVVVKPLFGGEGRGITRINDDALALRAFKMLTGLGAVLYVQEFTPHEGWDARLLVVGDETLAMRRRHPLDWRTNVSRGAVAEPYAASDELINLARRAAGAIGAPIAGVDLLSTRDGKWQVLEVNGVPGWKALARTVKIDVAARVLAYVETRATRGER